MDRRKLAVIVLGSVVVSSGAGWIAGSQIRSPAEVAARTAAPEPSPILVPAENRVLSTDVVVRGTTRFGSPQRFAIAASALKTNAGVIARVPLLGDELVEGDVILTASNRPVFLLTGEQPVFRDLGPGLEGEDVLQLEDGLLRLGFDPGPVDGVYDKQTETAVTAWYEAAGYQPFETTPEQLVAIRAAEADLLSARLDILAARESVAAMENSVAAAQAANSTALAVNRGNAGLTSAEAEARAANEAAAAEVHAKQTALDGILGLTPASPPTQSEIAAAQSSLAAAQANAQAVHVAGASAVAEAQANLNGAPAALAAAQAQANAANQTAAADVAAKQAALAALQADPSATQAEINAAASSLSAAQASATSIHLNGLQAVATAQAALNGAPAALATAQANSTAADQAAVAEVAAKQAALQAVISGAPAIPPTAAEIASARAALSAAQANAESIRLNGERLISEASSTMAAQAANVTAAGIALISDNTALSLARQAVAARQSMASLISTGLGLAQRRAGIQVPADELLFARTAPVRVAELTLARGDPLTGVAMTATDAIVVVDGSLPLEAATLVKKGMPVQISEPDLGIEETGVVGRVAETPGTNGVDGFHVYFEVIVDGAPAKVVGASVRLTVPIESTGGEVLAVPVSALTLAADGSSRVQRQRDGTLQSITVTPGLSADGFVGVTPVNGDLTAGDLVFIGLDQTAVVPGG